MRAIARHAPVQQKSRISNDGMLKRVTTTFRTSRGVDTSTLRKRGILGAGAPSHFGRCHRRYAVPARSWRAYDTLQSEGLAHRVPDLLFRDSG